MHSSLCPECGEPPHYHSFCTLCAKLFRSRPLARLCEQMEAIRASMLACQAEGLTRNEAMHRLGLSGMQFDYRRRHTGLSRLALHRNPARWSFDRLRELEKLLDTRETRRAIAARLGLSPQALNNVIRRHLPHLLIRPNKRAAPCASIGQIPACKNVPPIFQRKDTQPETSPSSSA